MNETLNDDQGWFDVFPMIWTPQGTEWIVILAIVILVFGAAKLPELASGTGQALRIFKAEIKGLLDDEETGKPGPAPKQAAELRTASEGEVVDDEHERKV